MPIVLVVYTHILRFGCVNPHLYIYSSVWLCPFFLVLLCVPISCVVVFTHILCSLLFNSMLRFGCVHMSLGLVVLSYSSVCEIGFVHMSFALPNWFCSHILRFAKLVVFTCPSVCQIGCVHMSFSCQIGCVHMSFGLPNWLCSRVFRFAKLVVFTFLGFAVRPYPSVWLCIFIPFYLAVCPYPWVRLCSHVPQFGCVHISLGSVVFTCPSVLVVFTYH